MAIELGFRIERGRGAYPAKIRGDGRVGACVGDEALLWDAYQEACARAEDCAMASLSAEGACVRAEEAYREARAKLVEALAELDALRRENADLKAQLEQKKGRRYA